MSAVNNSGMQGCHLAGVSAGRVAARETGSRGSRLLIAGLSLMFAGATALVVAQEARDLDPQRAHLRLSQIAPAGTGPDVVRNLDEQPEVRSRYDRARELLAEGQLDKAVTELDLAVRAAAGPCYDVLFLLAQVKAELGQFGEARVAAEQAAAARPGAPGPHLLLGRLHRADQRPELSIGHFRAATWRADDAGSDPDVTAAWFELGNTLAEEGYVQAAAEALERFDRAVWEEHPDHAEDVRVAGVLRENPYGMIERRLELLARLGQRDERVRAAKWACDVQRDAPYLERLYVRTLVEAQRPAEAFEFCRERLTHDADDEQATDVGPSQGRAAAFLALAVETGRAADRLGQWVRELAEDVTAGRRVALGQRLARELDAAQEHARAVPLWRALAAATPDSVDAAWALARALKESGDLHGALESLSVFVRQNAAGDGEQQEVPPERLADWMRSFQATDEFLRIVQDWTARADCDFAQYTVLGMTAAAAGQFDLAERLFASAVEARPGFALARVAWGRMLLGRYRWDDALEQARLALEAAPGLAAAEFIRGEAYTGLDDEEQAERAYKAAVTARPDEVGYVVALARHYRRAGNSLGAQRYLQQAWSLQRGLADVIEELIDSYLETGKVEIAQGCLREAEAAGIPDDVLRRIRTTLRFAGAPLHKEHVDELARQFAAHPEDGLTGLKLGVGLYMAFRTEEAYEVMERVRALLPDDERVLFLVVRVQLRRLQYGPAIEVLEELVRRFPRRSAALRLLADSYLADFRLEEARQMLRRILVLELRPAQRDGVRTQLLRTYLDFGEFEAALRVVEEWRGADMEETAWARAKLTVLLAAERHEQAVELATTRLDAAEERCTTLKERVQELHAKARAAADETDSDDPTRRATEVADIQAQLKSAERELGACVNELNERQAEFVRVCVQAKHPGAAIDRVRTWLAEQPGQPQVHGWLVELLLADKQPEAALEALSTVVPKNPPDVVEVVINRARCFAAAERLDEALDTLKNLLEQNYVRATPTAQGQVRREMVALATDGGAIDRALRLCDTWLAGAAEDDQVTRLEALLLKRAALAASDRLEEQIPIMEELLEFEPYDPGLNNDLGYTWADRGENLGRALEMTTLAAAAEPLNAAYLDSLGWVYYKRGDFDAARKWLARAARLREGADATILDHLGDAEYRLGDGNAARSSWERATTLLRDSGLPGAAARNAALLAKLRDKLAALNSGQPPAVAPTAAEQAPPSVRTKGNQT